MGPSNLIPISSTFLQSDEQLILKIMGVSLFAVGLSSAFLQTLSNIKSAERAQKWAQQSDQFKGGDSDVQPLLSKVQSWVIVMIGGGEACG